LATYVEEIDWILINTPNEFCCLIGVLNINTTQQKLVKLFSFDSFSLSNNEVHSFDESNEEKNEYDVSKTRNIIKTKKTVLSIMTKIRVCNLLFEKENIFSMDSNEGDKQKSQTITLIINHCLKHRQKTKIMQ
jgi:hypothetical protein